MKIEGIYRTMALSTIERLNKDYGGVNLTGMLNAATMALNSNIDMLNKKSRIPDIVELRFVCTLLIVEFLPSISLKDIGRIYNQDHASIINGIKRAKDLMDTHDELFINRYKTAREAVVKWIAQLK